MSAELTFTAPPPGLAPLVEFSLDKIDGADGLYSLQAQRDVTLRLFVLDAAVYLPDYHPAIPSAHTDALGLPETDPHTVLVVANPATGRCTQVILERGEWPVRAELTHVG